MSISDYKGSLRAALDLAAFAKRMDEEMAKHDCHGFEPVIMAVAQEVLGLNSAPVSDGGVDERAAVYMLRVRGMSGWREADKAAFDSASDDRYEKLALYTRAALTASAPDHSEQATPVPAGWLRFDDDQRAIFTRSKRGKDAQPLYPHPTSYRVHRTASAQSVPSVQITGHLDEVDSPVWEFIHAEARKLDPLTGSIDSYGFSRPNGSQPNGGVVVLWNGQKIHAVALAVRDAMNRTQCIRLLAPAPGKPGVTE